MKRPGLSIVLLASMPILACGAEHGDFVDFVPRWKMPRSGAKYVKIEGDRLIVDVPVGISNVCAYATAEIDLSGWAQRSFEAEIRCRGERLVRDSRRDRGVKLSLHYVSGKGEKLYSYAPAPEEGDFGWTNLQLFVTFGAVPAAKSSRPKVVLGLQQTSGRIEFDLSSLRLRNTPPPYPVADNDYQVQYPPEIASRGRMRGVMGRGVCKNRERDIEDLKNYGANLIRLQMNGFALKRPLRSGEKPKTLSDWNKWFSRCLDDAERVLGIVEKRGMMMVLDMHNTPLGGYGTFADAFYVQENADRFVEAWREIAIRFKGRKGIYGYDLMNEPAQSRRALQGCDYWNLQRRAAEAIREVDPDATIVFAANDWSAPEAFEYLVALDMDNVVYEVHMYRPNRYTHQGANGRARPQPGTEIPYPDPERGVDKTRLREYLKPVRDFQKRHGAKIYVGEFSACIYAPGAGQYLRDCISIFEEYGWDWTYHSFREALWWNVETVIDDKTGDPVPNNDNDRFRALVDGFKGQVSPAAAQGALRPFTAGPEAFDPKGGHIQGVAAGEDALYVSQMTRLAKLDWEGNVLATRAVTSHTGDIAWHDGELYTAVAVYPECKAGRIQVFDKDLNLLRETVIDRTIDGIAYVDGVLYVGMGARDQPSKNPHRVNIIGRFDAKTLKEVAPRAEFDYGHETRYGFQNIANVDGTLFASFYAVAGSPSTVLFDKSLNVLGTLDGGPNQGFDVLPASLRTPGARFVRATTKRSKSLPSVSCAFDFFDFR